MDFAITETTAPTVEPVTRTELKDYLRLDTTDDALSLSQSIAPGAHVIAAAYSLKGSGVNVSGSTATVYLNSGTNGSGGTVDVKLQESNTDIDGNYTDVVDGAFTQITETGAGDTEPDNATYELSYTGGFTFIRVVATVATATCDFAVSVAEQASTTDENDLLDALIEAARRHCEIVTARSFISTTWTMTFDRFPTFFELPHPPGLSVTSIKYFDADDTQQILSTDDYDTDFQSEPARVVEDPAATWPTVFDKINAVELIYKAGYGTTAADVPEQLKLAIKLLAAHWYEHREPVVLGVTTNSVPLTVESLLMHYRIKDFA